MSRFGYPGTIPGQPGSLGARSPPGRMTGGMTSSATDLNRVPQFGSSQAQVPQTTPGSLSRYGTSAQQPGVRQPSNDASRYGQSTGVRTPSNDAARRAAGLPGTSFTGLSEGRDGRKESTPQRSPSAGQTGAGRLQRSLSGDIGSRGDPGRADPRADPGRSASPPNQQSAQIRTMSDLQSRRQQLREKDEELMKVKEQLTAVKQGRATDERDKSNLENDFRRANAAKQKLAVEREALQKENKRLKETVAKARAKGVSRAAPPEDRSVLNAKENVLQLERQILEKKEDLKVVEEMLKGEIDRLTKQCDSMSQAQTSMDESAAKKAESMNKELQDMSQALRGPNKEAQYAMIEQSLEKSLSKQQQLQERLVNVNREKTKLEEEWAKAEYGWERRWEQCQDERAQWQREREEATAAKQRIEKVESMLRQQVTTLQDKLESLQKKDEEIVEERRSLRTRVGRLQSDLARTCEERESAMQTRGKDLEIQVGTLRIEASKLRGEVMQLRTQKEEADGKCSQLRGAIEKLEEKQRFSSGRSGSRGPGGRPASMRSLSVASGNSTRFRASLKGQNCSMTVDGATVTRTKGCRQCVVIGDHALDLYAGVGWYFELRINEVVTGWVGGLGLGITMTKPSQVQSLPDRAWRIPNSWMAGYWGRMFTNGQQHLIDWKPQDLRTNDKVGFLVTPRGACVVYVNGEEKVHFSDVPVPIGNESDVEMTALVDVFASTASVSIVESQPPESAEVEEDEEPEDEEP